MDLKQEFMRTTCTGYLEGNFGVEIVASLQKKKKRLKKKLFSFALVVFAWRSMMDPCLENVLKTHSHEFSSFVNMHTVYFSELYQRCKKLWPLFTTACNADTKTPRWCMRIPADLT